MKKIQFIIVFIILTLSLLSCVTKPPSFLAPQCPVKEQSCHPGEWKGIAYDTTHSVVKTLPSYYIFEPVQSINTPNDEWSLSFIDSKKAALLFTDGDRLKLMEARIVNDNKATIEGGIGAPIEGSLGSFSVKGDKAVISAVKSDELMGNSDIYTAKLSDNILIDFTRISKQVNYDKYTWESQPSFSKDGDVIFFASDRPGGHGGTDIWYTMKLIDGSWSEPMNCGDTINTECDELTPFIQPDGKKLFYSSNGHVTVGGYDIFSCDISMDFWIKAKFHDSLGLKKDINFKNNWNLRPPLNTKADEIYPSSPSDPDSLLYYSSNQAPSEQNYLMRRGGFDIFVRRKVVPKEYIEQTEKGEIAEGTIPDIDVKDKIPVAAIPLFSNYSVVGKIYDATTKEIITNADVVLTNRLDTIPLKTSVSKTDGSYRFDDLSKAVEYNLVAEAPGYFYDSYILKLDPSDSSTLFREDFYLPLSFTLRINFHYDKFDEPYTYVLDSNGIETNRTWNEELDILAQNLRTHQNEINKINMVGHTDDIASEQYNYQLGLKRVKFVLQELIKRGVPKELFKISSAGKQELLPFRNPNEDIEIRRKRCRRIEFSIELKGK